MPFRLLLFTLITAVVLGLIAIAAANASVEPAADATRGKQLFEHRCTGCHSLDGEKEGPRLRTVFGRRAGTIPTFTYSDALKKSQIVWDETTLNNWLTDPDSLVPGNDMSLRLPAPQPRADIIAYLKLVSGK